MRASVIRAKHLRAQDLGARCASSPSSRCSSATLAYGAGSEIGASETGYVDRWVPSFFFLQQLWEACPYAALRGMLFWLGEKLTAAWGTPVYRPLSAQFDPPKENPLHATATATATAIFFFTGVLLELVRTWYS